MSDRVILKALASRPKSLNLDSKGLVELPKAIGQLGECLRNLSARNNKLTCVPTELDLLKELSQLNLGNNEFETVPLCVSHMSKLEKLHLYHNKISSINPVCIVGLHQLTTLNCNGNQLQQLPSQIKFVTNLQVLSVSCNCLTGLPDEVTLLPRLRQLHCDDNEIVSLPEDIGKCRLLVKLYVHKNCLETLPEERHNMTFRDSNK
ncbi:leucine-rich repeat-containing protein 69-like [Dysidea avara]|uniref:leucine-rich repeat-containing protein 69-like n=1 Tax=Dysidea avara TaxID=196820 RepID=UPI00332E91CF